MRNASPALIALLNAGTQFVAADLITIIQADGTITRLTNAATGITAESQYDSASHRFSAGLPFTRGKTSLVLGTEVDTLAVTLTPALTQLLGGVPWPAAAAAGALDDAELLLEKLIMPSWGDVSAGTLILFWGRITVPVISRSTVQMTVKSDMQLFQNVMPRNVYQTGCLHTLFDTGCTLLEASYVITDAAAAGSTATVIQSGLLSPSTYYDLGAITITAGANAGLSRPVKSYLGTGQVTLSRPFPVAPAIGDAFSIVPGCDKTLSACTGKFGNAAHFRGFTAIPVPEAAR